MDNLVLTTVTMALDRALRGAVLEELRQETADRFRFRWTLDGRPLSTVVSMRPESPWIGRPVARAPRKPTPAGRFAATLRKSLVGARIESIEKPSSDRVIEFRFADGRRLVVELALHGANLVQLDQSGNVVAALRKPRSARERFEPGSKYAAPARPAAIPDPLEMSAGEIDARLDALVAAGEPPFEALRRHLFGVGSPAARLVVEEARGVGGSPGEILGRRLTELRAGTVEPVIEAGELWPWPPLPGLVERADPVRGVDAAETAGRWYEERDRVHLEEQRRRSLRQIVRREAKRVRQARRRCEADVSGFEDPDRFRRWAEALLAGLSRATRVGRDAVRVPNPEDPEAGDYVIPAAPGTPLPAVAEKLFARRRRSLRGHDRARRRLDELTARAGSLDALERDFEGGLASDDLVEAMKCLRLPVDLRPTTRAGREASHRELPRLEGVRVYYASSGEMILAGKGAKENHRLTFKLAAPHDFWLHAQGVTGAHVVLRNDSREPRPAPPALAEAAAVAAFHSESSGEARVDVQWTQRKNVRKPRGAAPGTVIVKRFETIRVRPEPVSQKPAPIL